MNKIQDMLNTLHPKHIQPQIQDITGLKFNIFALPMIFFEQARCIVTKTQLYMDVKRPAQASSVQRDRSDI